MIGTLLSMGSGVPYARWTEMLGFKGIRVEDPDEVAGAWEEAFSADRPVVYEAIVDADAPPMPPHISFDQAKAITRALYRGDPAAAEIIRHSFAALVEEYIPHR
jgi:pyruvate dehydrogenase (quinone)